MSHDRAKAKAKELETRKALGPRLGHAKVAPRRVTLEPRQPRATGASGAAMRGGEGQDV